MTLVFGILISKEEEEEEDGEYDKIVQVMDKSSGISASASPTSPTKALLLLLLELPDLLVFEGDKREADRLLLAAFCSAFVAGADDDVACCWGSAVVFFGAKVPTPWPWKQFPPRLFGCEATGLLLFPPNELKEV